MKKKPGDPKWGKPQKTNKERKTRGEVETKKMDESSAKGTLSAWDG